MSTSMVVSAGDMASFNNASPEETLAALKSGLAGESEPLRKYGVFLNDARLKQEAMKQGLYSGKGALDAHAKAAASMAIIMKDTGDAQGDFARTSESAANQSRTQAAEMENLSAELGQSLLPLYEDLQRILLKVTGFLSEHTTAVEILVGIIATLAGGILAANAAMKAYKVLQVAVKVATAAWAVAQRALNLALTANPIGLIIAALALLVVGLVVAYKKSETFRDVVNGALDAVKKVVNKLGDAFQGIWDTAKSAFNWITDHWKVAQFSFGPIGDALKKLGGFFGDVKDSAVSAFNRITELITGAVNAVKSLIDWIGKIKMPKISIPHIGKSAAGAYYYAGAGPQATLAGASSGAGAGVTVNFYGPTTDPEGTARAIARVMRAHELRQGRSSRAAWSSSSRSRVRRCGSVSSS